MKKILLVDDEPINLRVLQKILQDRYQLFFATNGEKALEMADQHHPDLILLDILMPTLDGYDACLRLKANPSTRTIPVIFITSMNDDVNEERGFQVGGVDYIQKPISPSILLCRVQTHLSLVRAQELEDSHKQAIFMLGEAGHYNDNDTGVHIWRMAEYSSAIARAMGWSDDRVEMIGLAAAMHDTGKIGIPDAILKAPRKLTDEEWGVMKQHSEIGFGILNKSPSPMFKMAAEIARHHHEKWDGTGYPEGLAGEDIPESALIVALADVFDALTMKRPYKDPWSVEDCVAEIRRTAGNHFSPQLVDVFERILPDILVIKSAWVVVED